MLSALVVDFHGPIAFRFSDKDGGWAWVYIPICDYHTCNVLSDTNDFAAELHRTFTLTGPTKASKTKIPRDADGKLIGADLVQDDWAAVNRCQPPSEHECYCIFKFPLPDYIVGLRKEPATIEKIPGHPDKRDYARGHRFCYLECNSDPKITSSKQPSKLENLDARCFQPQPNSDVKYRIEIRYHDINPLQPRPYRDADLCSASLRRLFPPFDIWKVIFDDPEEIVDVVGPQGSDCGAPGLVLNDGGIA